MVGDTVAAVIQDDFMLMRMLAMLAVGATIYAFEIPNYFNWIDRKTKNLKGWKLSLSKTGLAMLYFNPLWIARHLLIIMLVTSGLDALSWNILTIALISFGVNIPISVLGNYIIQNVIALNWRFMASAIFSALMAIYYALSAVWFS